MGKLDTVGAPLFVGFAALDGWLAAIGGDRPALVMALVEPGADQGGIAVDELAVHCQQVSGDGCVLYCRLRAASMTRCYGEPFDPDWKERERVWHSLRDAVRTMLCRAGIPMLEATVARQKGLQMLEGRPDPIKWDKEGRVWLMPEVV